MSDQIEIMEEKDATVFEPVLNVGRKAVYLGLGTVGLTYDGIKKAVSESGRFSNKLVKRGEGVATETRGRMSRVVGGRQDVAIDTVKDTVKKAGDTFDKYSEQVLTRAHIPTSEDIDSVTKKVASIERKLDKAIKDGAAATTPTTSAK